MVGTRVSGMGGGLIAVPLLASACFLGRKPDGLDDVRVMLDDVCGVAEKLSPWDCLPWQMLSCHVGLLFLLL